MQKGKAVASPPAMILQNRAPQQNARGPLPSQQRSDDFNPRQAQPYQIPPGQMHQNLFTQQMPGPPQGQPRLPNQQPFYPNQRPMRIPRHQPPNNQPMYSSPPGGPPMAVQMIGHPGTTQFIPPGQHPSFITQPVDFSLAMGSSAQMQYHRPQQPMQGQFAPVSGPSRPQGEPERELTEVHCDESKISLEHLEELKMGECYIRSDLTTQLMEMKKQLGIKDELLKVRKQQLRRSEDQLREKDERQQTLQRQLITLRAEKETKEKENEKLQDQLSVKLKEFAYLEKEFRDSVQDQVDLKRELSVANEKLSKYESQLMTRDWIISRDEIEIMFDNCLGDGGYGKVFRGRYRGFVVAVKTFKDFSLKDGGRDLFEREMDIASRCRHPCLLQFIGATQEEKPLFVTELMELSLRKLLKERPLSEKEIVVISLDVAHALNYLHNRKIVHRDVSSANVLLWKQNDQWRGKLGDYGTVKFLQEIMTKSPGAMIYSAPEAGNPFHQTVKIDVYSFGVLFCEMFTRKIPVFDERKKHIDLVPNRPGREFQDLVLLCTKEDPTNRPSMETVIKEVETTVQNLLE